MMYSVTKEVVIFKLNSCDKTVNSHWKVLSELLRSAYIGREKLMD